MPVYSYMCDVHGRFDKIQNLGAQNAVCPRCERPALKLATVPARISVQQKERLPYGYGSRGRYIPASETGGLPILVPSFGALDKSEVNYAAEAAIESEKERVRKRRVFRAKDKQRIGQLMDVALKAKPGQRANTIRQAMKESGLAT